MCVLAFAAPAFASSSPAPLPRVAAAPAVASSPATPVLTAALSKASVVFGDAVTVTGTLTPAAGGEEVTVTLGDASPARRPWTRPAPTRSRSRRTAAATSSRASAATRPSSAGRRPSSVKPKATVTHGALVPFLSSTCVVKVAPAAYDGLVVVKVIHRGAIVGTYKARAKDGKATLHIPFRGVDGFTLES